MKQKIAIYLAGSIKKDHEKSHGFWTDADINLLKKHLDAYDVSFLNPSFRTDDLSDQFSVFGRDMLQVFSSTIVFVDARDRRGLGVGAEMMWAKVNKIPVITWAPRNSHYYKDQAIILDKPVANFIHPFVEALSDKIVEDLAAGAQWIHALLSGLTTDIKSIEYIGAAIQYYKNNQLHHDKPMQELLASSEELQQRAHHSHPHLISHNN